MQNAMNISLGERAIACIVRAVYIHKSALYISFVSFVFMKETDKTKMSTLFQQHLCDIWNQSLVNAKIAYESDVSHRLLLDVIDKLQEAKESLRNQARALKKHWRYEFCVDISDIRVQHQNYLSTLPAGQSTNKDLDMVKGLLTRRLPEEFGGMHVTFNEVDDSLVFVVAGSL